MLPSCFARGNRKEQEAHQQQNVEQINKYGYVEQSSGMRDEEAPFREAWPPGHLQAAAFSVSPSSLIEF